MSYYRKYYIIFIGLIHSYFVNAQSLNNIKTPFSLQMNPDSCLGGLVMMRCSDNLYPLRNIRVRLEHGGEQLSDDNGRFSFCGLPLNVSHLIAIRPDFKIEPSMSHQLVQPDRFADVFFDLPCDWDYVRYFMKQKTEKPIR